MVKKVDQTNEAINTIGVRSDDEVRIVDFERKMTSVEIDGVGKVRPVDENSERVLRMVASWYTKDDEGLGETIEGGLKKITSREFWFEVESLQHGPELDNPSSKHILHPLCNAVQYWNLSQFVFVVVSLMFVPLLIAFDDKTLSVVTTINNVIDGFFLVDIFVVFRTGYLTEVNSIVLEPSLIARHYVTSTFLMGDYYSSLYWYISVY